MIRQREIIEKLLDVPNILEDSIFNELVNENNNSICKLSCFVLSNMWNNSEAVKYGFVSPRMPKDFL